MTPLRPCCGRCAAPLHLVPHRVVVAVPVQHPDRRVAEVLVTCPHCGSTGVHGLPHHVAAALVVQGAGCLPALDVDALSAGRPRWRSGAVPPRRYDDV